ncbi:MAG: hypothetical protein M1607_00525 [Patescibacteria group bacterium]|nr:hypothetical protein [Patescibacteria group bacterium]
MQQTVLIIGAGSIGKALGTVLNKKDINVYIDDVNQSRIPDHLLKISNKVLKEVDFMFLCIPSWSVRQVITQYASYIHQETIVVCLAKGLEEKSRLTMNEVLEQSLPTQQPFALLAGPMLAEEIHQGDIGIGVIAAKNKETFLQTQKLFTNTKIILEYQSEIHSVALASVLKNIYAIALGITEGLNFSSDFRGWLVSQAILEMMEILGQLGGKSEVMLTTAGLADFIATGFSTHSKNRRLGLELVITSRSSLRTEGMVSLPILLQLLKFPTGRYKILQSLAEIIITKHQAKFVFTNLLNHI